MRRSADGPVRVTTINNTFQSCVSFEASYANPAIERIAGGVLDDWQPDVVHVQHLTCLSTGIPGRPRAVASLSSMTLNDYWLICHRGQLVDLDGRRCDGSDSGGCAGVSRPASAAANPPGSLQMWRAARELRTRARPGGSTGGGAVAHLMGYPSCALRAASPSRDWQHMREADGIGGLFPGPVATIADRFSAVRDRPGATVHATRGSRPHAGQPGGGTARPRLGSVRWFVSCLPRRRTCCSKRPSGCRAGR